MAELDHEAWLAKARADFDGQARWSWHPPTDEQRAAFEENLVTGWQNELREREERLQWHRESFVKHYPARAAQFALDADTSEPIIAKVIDWAKVAITTGGILVLAGPTGAGKTVAACRAAWEQLQAGQDWPLFIRAAQLATLSRYDDSRTKYLKAPSLVIDDLGAEFLDKSGSFLVDLDELVDRYYANRRRLVITTNTARAAFVKRYGARIDDRIAEAGTWISVVGESRRRKAKS